MVRRPWQVTPGTALLPLRVFLGVTFTYAGFQKLSDPNFLTRGAPTSIGTQLHAFAAGTPGGFILRWFAEPFPTLAGLGAAVFEIAVGLLIGFGLFTRWAALAGLLLNLLLFLTASWNTYPYFLGSDIVFVFAWLPFVLTASSGQPAIDSYIARKERERGEYERARRSGRLTESPEDEGDAAAAGSTLTRGVALAAVGAATLAGVAGVFRGPASHSTHLETLGGHRRSDGPPSPGPANSVRLGPASALKPGQAADYNDPSDGNPDVVVRLADGKLTAFSAICTHAGCTVDYAGGVLVCPCHGSQFSAETGAVLQGPAVTPLARKRVIQQGGQIYALRT